MPKLILARHGATPYNEMGRWTGLTDIDLSPLGFEEAGLSAAFLAGYTIDVALCSSLKRARHTAETILKHQATPHVPLLSTNLLDEKNYGVFTGKDKQQVRAQVGDDVFALIRRSWDHRIDSGESLQDVHSRIMPLHEGVVVPLLEAEKTVLVTSHNNTLRAYVKEVECIPIQETPSIELGTAEVRVYNYHAGAFELEHRHAVGAVH